MEKIKGIKTKYLCPNCLEIHNKVLLYKTGEGAIKEDNLNECEDEYFDIIFPCGYKLTNKNRNDLNNLKILIDDKNKTISINNSFKKHEGEIIKKNKGLFNKLKNHKLVFNKR